MQIVESCNRVPIAAPDMSDTDQKPEEEPEKASKEAPPSPPPIMPTPDIVDGSKAGPTYGGDPTKQKAEKGKRKHPLDPYAPLKKRKGCGCCGCLGGGVAVIVALFLVLVLVIAWAGPARYLFRGYEVVNLEDEMTTITTAPTEPTYYLGQKIDYQAPATSVSIAILGTEVSLSGKFEKSVSVTAAKFFGKPSTAIAGDLEVYAAEFYDEGIQLNGELSGSVMKNIYP